MSTAHTNLVKVYDAVIDDVVNNMHDTFTDEGIDDSVLHELKNLWKTKLMAHKAMQLPPPVKKNDPEPPVIVDTCKSNKPSEKPKPTVNVQGNSQISSQSTPQVVKMVNVQLTLPPPPGAVDQTPRVFNIQVPSSAVEHNLLQQVLTAPVISATMALPVNVASTLLQQHVTSALQTHLAANPGLQPSARPNIQNVNGNPLFNPGANSGGGGGNNVRGHLPLNVPQLDGAHQLSDEGEEEEENEKEEGDEKDIEVEIIFGGNKLATAAKKKLIAKKKEKSSKVENKCAKVVPQLDGNYDLSDDDEIDDEIDDEDDDDDDDEIDDEYDLDDDDREDEDLDDEGRGSVLAEDEESLNSADDVSETESPELFNTDHVVVCQYDKITRSRNKWKFFLKDGILNAGGRDMLFQRANGEAEW